MHCRPQQESCHLQRAQVKPLRLRFLQLQQKKWMIPPLQQEKTLVPRLLRLVQQHPPVPALELDLPLELRLRLINPYLQLHLAQLQQLM